MGNQNQNQKPGQNPSQKAPGQDDKSRQGTNQQNQDDKNRQQRTPGASDSDNQKRMQDQDKHGNNR
ncbi:MAG TPA: hypothetical protein VFV97_07430 [Rhodanobacteraceae bacterium]|nr:hypothetical protein [Rhodanobacteraceae bacterium]